MGTSDPKYLNPDEYAGPKDDEESLVIHRDWSKEEETKAKRK